MVLPLDPGIVVRVAGIHGCFFLLETLRTSDIRPRTRQDMARRVTKRTYRVRFLMDRTVKAPPSASSPNSATSGKVLAVAGSVFSATSTGAAASAGAGVVASTTATAGEIGRAH